MSSRTLTLTTVRCCVVNKVCSTLVSVAETFKYSAQARNRAVWVDALPGTLDGAAGGAQKAPCFRLEGQLREGRALHFGTIHQERCEQVLGDNSSSNRSQWLASKLDKRNSDLSHKFRYAGSFKPAEFFGDMSEKRQQDKALDVLLCMDQEGSVPSVNAYMCVLKECTKRKALDQAKEVRAHMARTGLETTRFLGENMVRALVKCGGLEDALELFQRLQKRTVFSWTAVLSGYISCGQYQEALNSYELMLEEGVHPNAYTFVTLLKAIASMEDLQEGRRFHAETMKYGYGSDLFVGNCLVNMYGRCGSIMDAQNVFEQLSERDVVSWNTMLAVYAQQGQAGKTLQLFDQMREEGISPDDRTFVSVLQACCLLADMDEDAVLDGQSMIEKVLEKGRAIHADARRNSYDLDVFVGSTLVCMYGKCGSIVDAQNVFDGLSQRDLVTWNVMLAAYVKQEQAESALHLYDQMQHESVNPDTRTFVSALQACGMLAGTEECCDGTFTKAVSFEKGKKIHSDAQRKGYDLNVFVGNALIGMYSKCGSIADARNVFDGLSSRDVVSWNTMLKGYVEHGQVDEALQLYRELQQEPINPDMWTFVSALQACGMRGEKDTDYMSICQSTQGKSLELGKEIHASAREMGYHSDIFVASALVCMYGKCGSITDARSVFDGVIEPNVVCWTAMINAYICQDLANEALQLYKKMREEGLRPNETTLVCILQACGNKGNLSFLRQIHHTLVVVGGNLSTFIASALISAYGRCSSMVDALTVFDGLSKVDVVSWNAVIASYARQGDCVASLQYYEKMQQSGVNPNGVTFVSLLSACSHAGFLEKGINYFESMSRDHRITPAIEHYVCMVDIFGRAGCFKRVQDLLSTMPVQPNLAMWSCLLGACQKHHNVVLGKQAFDSAVSLEPKHPSAYVLMSKIFADAGLWSHAKEVNASVQQAGAWKKPCGQSWVEHEQDLHTFVAADCKHVQQDQVYAMLGRVS